VKLIVTSVALALVVAGRLRSVDACELLTAQEASTLIGFAVTRAENTGGAHCRYNKPGEERPADNQVAIVIRRAATADEAHTLFLEQTGGRAAQGSEMRSVPPLPKDVKATPATGVGDEVAIMRGPPSDGRSAIAFRRGAVLVTIGARPAPSDAALMVAGNTAVGRL
jgi:hypothetical protein